MSTDHRAGRPQPDERLAEALASAVEAMIDYELDAEARQVVHDTVGRHQALAHGLRAVPRTNADEPDFMFLPYRAEG